MESQVKVRASIVVGLIDVLTGKPPKASGVNVSIKGLLVGPIRKNDGFYVFPNLSEGMYDIVIKSIGYHDVQKTVTVGKDCLTEGILYIPLLPTPSYPSQNGITRVRMLLQSDEKPVSGIKVKGVIQDPKCVVAKLAQASVESKQKKLMLAKNDFISIGDTLLIKDKLTKRSEVFSISNIIDNNIYELDEGLTYSYKRGALILPVVVGYSAANGEVMLFLRNYSLPTFGLKLEICGANQVTKEIEVTESNLTNVGILQI